MTHPRHTLDNRLLWDEQGHLSELAVTALADGELSLVDPAAVGHADACPACANRVGQAALLALDLSEALLELPARAAPRVVAKRRPLPLGLLAAALSIALLGSLPNLSGLWRVPALLVHALPALVRASLLVLHSPSGSRALAIAGVASAALLLLMGITIARLDLQTLGQPLEKAAR